MIPDPRQDLFDLADQQDIFRQLTRQQSPQPTTTRGEREYADFLEDLEVNANVGSMSFSRAEASRQAALDRRTYGKLKDNVQNAEMLGHDNPKHASELYDFNFKIQTPDAQGNLVIKDSRTLGWADASEASFAMANTEVQRGIVSRNAAGMNINKNLMFGGAREFFENRGLSQKDTPYDQEVKDITVASDGFNMDPRNWRTSFDLFGYMDSPDTNALKWVDPSFNAKEYLNEINALKPEYTSLLMRNGVDIEALKKTTNANQFWMQINKQQVLMSAATSIAMWKEKVPEYQEWAMLTKDFIRDSLINDPDFAGEMVLTGALGILSAGTAVPGLMALSVARKGGRGVKVAKHMLKASRMIKKAAQKANNALPQNWGLTFGHAIRNTQVGKFLSVTSDDFIVDGVRFGKTRKYGSKLAGYTLAEVPAGFIEEGIAGAYNAYTINQLDTTEDRSLFKSFVNEGIQGSLVRAFAINPLLRGFNFGIRYGTSKAGNIALNNIGFLGGEAGWAQSLGGAFMEARRFADLDDVQFLDNEIDTIEVLEALRSMKMRESDLVAELEGTTLEQLVNEHPAMIAISEMLKFDQEGRIIGRDPETGELKIVSLLKEARREVARARVFKSEGIEDPDIDLEIRDTDTDVEKQRKKELNDRIEDDIKNSDVTNDEINLAMLHTFWGKLDADAKSSYEAQQMRNMAYFKVQVRGLAIERMRAAQKEGRKLTIEEAQQEVLRDPDLLTKIDSGGIATELDQLIAKQHPELFDERLVYNEETGEQSVVFVPKSMVVDKDGTVMAGEALTEMLNNIRRNVNFDTQRAAIMNHRKKLGMVKDVRFAIDEALNQRVGEIFGKLQGKISHGKNFERVQNFVRQEYGAAQKGTVITVDGKRGTLKDIDDADIIVLRTQVRGTKTTGELTFKGYNLADGTLGDKVVIVEISAFTIEHAETFRNFLNSLEVIDKLEVEKIQNSVRPVIVRGLNRTLNLDNLSDTELDEVYGIVTLNRDPSLRSPELRETREGFPIVEEPTARQARRQQQQEQIIDALADILVVRAVSQFEGASEVQTSMLARINGLLNLDEGKINSIVSNLRRSQFGRSLLQDVGNVFGIELAPLEGLPVPPTDTDATDRLRDAMGVPRDSAVPPQADRPQPPTEDPDAPPAGPDTPIGPQPFIGPQPRVGKSDPTPTPPADIAPTPKPAPPAETAPVTEPDPVTEPTPPAETSTEDNAEELDNALESAATTTTSDSGDQLNQAMEDADTGKIAQEKDTEMTGDLAKAAELRKEANAIQERIAQRNSQLDSSGQRVVNNARTRGDEIRTELKALEQARTDMRAKDDFSPEDGEYVNNMQRTDKLEKELQKLEQGAVKAQLRTTENNKDANEADLKRLQEIQDEMSKLAPDTQFTVTEELWAQVEVLKMKRQKYDKAYRALNKLVDPSKKAMLSQIQSALATAGIYQSKDKIGKDMRDQINRILKNQKKDPLPSYKDNTEVNVKLFNQAFKAYSKGILRIGKQPLTKDELGQASVMAKIGKSKWSDLSDMDSADAIAAYQIDSSTDPLSITDKPFTGIMKESFNPLNRLTGDLEEDEKIAALAIQNNLEFVKTLQNSLINVFNTLNRRFVTAAELASFALGTTTRVGNVNVGAVYAKLNFDVIFPNALRKGDDGKSVQFFSVETLLDELDMHQARLEFAMPTKDGIKGQRNTLRKIEAARALLERDEMVPDPELLIEEVIELAEGDAEVLRTVGKQLFAEGSTAGRYLVGIDRNGQIIYNTDSEVYESNIDQAILTRLESYSTNRIAVRNIIDELIRAEIIPESARQMKILEDDDVLEFREYIREYLLKYPGNESGTLAAWGNGEVSYSFADQVGMGVVDTLAMVREGTEHENIESFNDEFKDGRIVDVDRVREGRDPNKYRGAPLRINMAEPMTAGRLQKLREDHRLMRINQFVLEQDLTPEQVREVFDWADTGSEATEVVTDAAGFIAGERPMPRILVSGPEQTLRERDKVIDDMLLTMSGVDQVLASTIHDAWNTQTNGVQPNGGFIDEGEFRKLSEKLGMTADGLSRVMSNREGAGAGAYGGLASGITSFGTVAFHANRGWEALFPIFRDAAIDSVASWEALNKAIAQDPTIEIKSLQDILSKETYFDGNFNGIHHKMALLFQWTNKQVFDGATREEIRAAIEGEGDAFDQFLAKQMDRINEEFKSSAGQDYYAKVAHDVMFKVLNTAYNGLGEAKTSALKTVESMKERGLLPETINQNNYKDILTVEAIGDESNADLNILRKLFKKPVMVYLYGAGFNKINSQFIDFMQTEFDMSMSEATEIALPLSQVAHGFGMKERQVAMTMLAKEESSLSEIIGGRNQMEAILDAMRKRMDQRGFNSQAVRDINNIIATMTGLDDLDNIQFNHIAFQIQARNAMIEDLIQVRLGYEVGTPEYNAVKKQINSMTKAAQDKQSQALQTRIHKGLDSISGKDPTGERAHFAVTDPAERQEYVNAIEIILTRDRSEWATLIPDFIDKDGNLKSKPSGKTLGKENIASILRLIRTELSQPITKSEAREIQDAAINASGIESGLFKAVKALNQVARKADMQSLEELMDFMGVSLLEPSMRETLSQFYSENETYRGIGSDLYSGRLYATEHTGSHQGPKGAQDKGQSASEPLLSMGVMVKTRPELTREKAEQMFARFILGRSANVKTDSNHIIIQLAKKQGRDDIVALLTPESELTEQQIAERDAQFVKQWLTEYSKLKDIERTFQQKRNAAEAMGHVLDPDGVLAQKIKLSAGLQAATQGTLDMGESAPSESIDQLIDRQIQVGVNYGLFSSRAQVFDTSFRDLGVPELKVSREKRKLGLSAKQRIEDVKQFQDEYTGFDVDDARVIKEEHVNNVLENSYETDPNSLLHEHRERLMQNGLRARVGHRTIQRVSFQLEDSLINFAAENGLINLVKSNDWQTLDYLRQAFIIREKNARLQAEEVQIIMQDVSKPNDVRNREIEARIHYWRRMTDLEIRAINQRFIDNNEARSYTTELTPAGNMGIVTKKILQDKDGNDRPVGQILAALSNDLNNLQSMGAFAIVPGVAFHERTRGRFDISENRDQPRVVHAHDVAHILTTVYDFKITRDYLLNNEDYTQTLIERKGLDMTVKEFVENLTVTGMELDLVEIADLLDRIEAANPTLAETVVFSNVGEAFMGKVSETETAAALNNDTRRSVAQGIGKVQEEQKVIGTTARFRLTLGQAKEALLALRNAPVLDIVSDVKYTGISGINRPRSRSSRLEVDHVTGQRVTDIRLRDELHAEALQAIVDRNYIRTTNRSDLPSSTKIRTVIGGRDRSMLSRLERRNRRLPKLTKLGKRQEQAIYLDYTNVSGTTSRGRTLYDTGLNAVIAAYQKNNIDLSSPLRKEIVSLTTNPKLNKTKAQRKTVLGYLLQHFEPTGIRVPGHTDVEIAVALAYINLGYGDNFADGTYATLQEELKTTKVQNTAKLMQELMTLNHTVISGEANPFFYDARGFVANLNISKVDLDTDVELFDVFQQYLKEQVGDEFDITNKNDVDTARKALEEALVSTDQHMNSYEFTDKTVLQIQTPEEVSLGFDLNPTTALLKETLNNAVENGHMAASTRDIVATVIGRMAALNPDLLNDLRFNIGRDAEGNVIEESRAMTIPEDDGYLVELSGRDAKKAPLEAAKILIHEIIHIGTFKYYDLDSSSQELRDIKGLMGQQSVSRLTYRLTKAMHGRLSDGEALARHRHYNNNPEEFIAETAAMYFMSEAAEDIDLILKEEAEKAEATDVETTEKRTFIEKFTAAFTRMLQNARVQINQMAAILKQYSQREEYKQSFDTMQKLAYRAAGIVVADGRQDATVVRKPNLQSYMRHHEESEIPTTESISDIQFTNMQIKHAQLEAKLNEATTDDRLSPEDFGGEIPTTLSEAEISEIIDQLADLEAQIQKHDVVDDFEVKRSARLLAEQRLIEAAEVDDKGVSKANIKDMLRETPALAMSIMMNNLRINKGAIHRTFIERRAQSASGRAALAIASDHAQTNNTIDSIFDMVVRLSLVIDSQALITEHMVSGEGSHDLLRAKQQVDNDMAFLRSQLRTLKPQDHPTVMEYLADETLEVREGEEAIKRVADLTRSSMSGIIQLAKDTGILFENLEYNPTPMKINETKLAQNEAGALTHLSELIGKKVVGELSRDNIDPLTLMNSGILPPLLITDRSANVDKLHINDQDRFIEHIVELAKTDEGIAAIRDIMHADFMPVGTRKQLADLDPSEIANYNPDLLTNEWSKNDLLSLQYGLRNLYKKGFQRQGMKRNVDGILALVKSRSDEYRGAVTKAFDSMDIEIFRANRDFHLNLTKPSLDHGEATMREEFQNANTPALFRARMFLGETQTGARFLAKDKNFDPSPAELMAKSRGDVAGDIDNPLYGIFVVDPNTLFDAVSVGLGFDAVASEALGNALGGDNYKITGIRFDDILTALMAEGSDQIVKNFKGIDGLSSTLKGRKNMSTLRTDLEVLQNKYNALAGRRMRIDPTQAGGITNKLAAVGGDLVLAMYGGNLTMATSIVEGTLAGLQMMGRGDMLLGPARLMTSIIKSALQGTISGAGKFAQEVGFRGDVSKGVAEFGMRNSLTELAFAHQHATVRGMEASESEGSLVTDSTLNKIGNVIGKLPRAAAKMSTSASGGVQNAIKFHVEGMAINTLDRLIKSGAIFKLSNFLSDPANAELLDINLDDGRYTILHKKIKRILRESGVQDFNFLGKQDVKIIMALMQSGAFKPEFLVSLNELLQKAGLGKYEFDGTRKKYDPEFSPLSQIARLQEVALMDPDPKKRKEYNDTINVIKEYVNREIEARFVGANPLHMDTMNSGFGVLLKVFRSYPTLFFNQRIRQDMKYYSPIQNATRLTALMALDIAYMVALEFIKSGFEEDRLEQLMEELQQKESLMRLMARTPTFGVWGGVIANGIAESVIHISGRKGYTQNLLNQAFMPVPFTRAQNIYKDVMDLAKYGFSDDATDAARFNLALLNLSTALPGTQEAFIKAAAMHYLTNDEMDDILLQKMRRRIPGGGGGGTSLPLYYQNPNDPLNNPGVVDYAAARNMWPDDMLHFDIMANLAHQPLRSLMGPEMPSAEELRAEAIERSQPSQTAAASPQQPVSNPPLATKPAVPTQAGSTPSARLAQALGSTP